jgi:hypothetical protein
VCVNPSNAATVKASGSHQLNHNAVRLSLKKPEALVLSERGLPASVVSDQHFAINKFVPKYAVLAQKMI